MLQQRILLIAPDGQVGWELLRCSQSLGQVFVAGRKYHGTNQTYIDLSDADSIRKVISEVKPNIILNAAAYTAVDKAEQEEELALKINGIAPGILAEEAKKLDALLVHYSTDYVFDGTGEMPYKEDDPVNPVSAYGRTKLAGEQNIQASNCKHFIFRTSWVYGTRGKNFLLTVQRLAKERDELRIVADQMGAPTWCRMIAGTTVNVLAQLRSPLCKADINELSGIYHMTNGGQTNWYEFAKAIVAEEEKQPMVYPITTAEYQTPAKRPAYSVLSNEKLINTFDIRLPDWDKTLQLCMHSRYV